MTILKAVFFGAAGLVVGWAYFFLMRFSLTQLATKRIGAIQFFLIALVRVLLFAGGLVGSVLTGPWSLVTYVVGFVVARTFVVSKARDEGKPASPTPRERKQEDD